MAQINKDLDIVVFGATGFTGRFVVEEICRTASDMNKLRWGIAGRSEQRLQEVSNIIGVASGNTVRQPEIIIADVERPESLNKMAKRAKVVIACVGPFFLYGESVVKACIENEANYVDIAGNNQFIILVPADLGILFTKRLLESQGAIPSQIEMFTSVHCGKAVHGINNVERLRELRKNANRPKVPRIGPPLEIIRSHKWDDQVKGYIYPSFLTDPSIIRLSQSLDIECQTGVPPVQLAAYLVFPSFKNLAKMMFAGALFKFLVKFSWGRSLLLKYPKVFTFGTFSHNGPTLEQIQQTSFTHKFVAKGILIQSTTTNLNLHDDDLESNASFERLLPPPSELEIVTEVTGPEPGYVTTPICVVQCAYTILKEGGNVPKGVLTPSLAFGKTSLIQNLMEYGINFREVDKS
nr:14902_t:CDS:2 [Entrophospora candida]